jgi:outer membrane protein assembly factor BamD
MGAYKAYVKMVQKYPASTFFEQALDREFAIGNLYLAGEPQRLWKVPLGPSMDKTIEIYEQVIKSAPYGTHAPEAQFKIGLAREQQKKWNDAVDSYTKILDKYPGNSIASDAQYQIGYAWYSSASMAEYDQSAAQKAIEAFEDFIVRYPNSEKVAAANAHIELLKGRQTQGSYNIAKFYEKQKNYKAAYIYYSDVVRQSPGSEDAQSAQKKIDTLRKLLGQDVNPEAPVAPAQAPAPVSASNAASAGPAAPPLPSSSN